MAMFHPFQDGGELAWDSLVQAKAEHLRELVSGEAEQSEVAALQAAADRLSPQVIRKQLDHWTWVVGPKFSQKDRAALILAPHCSWQQIEYSRHVPGNMFANMCPTMLCARPSRRSRF